MSGLSSMLFIGHTGKFGSLEREKVIDRKLSPVAKSLPWKKRWIHRDEVWDFAIGPLFELQCRAVPARFQCPFDLIGVGRHKSDARRRPLIHASINMMMKLGAFLTRHDFMINIHNECAVALNAVSSNHLREEAGLISRREFDAALQIE